MAICVSRRGMTIYSRLQRAKVGNILLWLIGVPLPILLLVYLLRGYA